MHLYRLALSFRNGSSKSKRFTINSWLPRQVMSFLIPSIPPGRHTGGAHVKRSSTRYRYQPSSTRGKLPARRLRATARPRPRSSSWDTRFCVTISIFSTGISSLMCFAVSSTYVAFSCASVGGNRFSIHELGSPWQYFKVKTWSRFPHFFDYVPWSRRSFGIAFQRLIALVYCCIDQ